MLRESAAREEEIFPIADNTVLENPRVPRTRSQGKKKNRHESTVTLSIAPSSAEPVVIFPQQHVVYQEAIKRTVDLTAASILLVATAPLMALVAVLVKMSSPGPIILRQTRLTAGGKTFPMFKFRSMRSDAESSSGPVLAKANDTRVTTIGRFIRLTRIDELPQFINIIRGEMSLIGPRPERPEIADQLRKSLPQFDRRLEVKAGLTGLAQVEMGYSGCTDSYRRKLAFDRLYVQRQSLPLDLWIALRTVWVMCTGRGAR